MSFVNEQGNRIPLKSVWLMNVILLNKGIFGDFSSKVGPHVCGETDVQDLDNVPPLFPLLSFFLCLHVGLQLLGFVNVVGVVALVCSC
jgi:hypothetical protein